jgi:hypothetical protein
MNCEEQYNPNVDSHWSSELKLNLKKSA